MRPRQKDRRETNPAFSTRRLKLGTFQTNLDSGCVMSRPRRPARHHLGQHRGAGQARRRDGVRGAGAGGALAGLGRQDQPAGAGLRGLHLGRRHCGQHRKGRRDLDLAHHHQPSDHRGEAIAPWSTTFPTAASRSTSSPAGCSRRSRCSASRCSPTRTATPAPRNGSPSSSGCGPRTSRSTTKAASSRSRRAIWRRSRSSTPTPRS